MPNVIKFNKWNCYYYSNFFERPIFIYGRMFKTSEHAFQFKKTLNPEWQDKIANAGNAKESRALGKACPIIKGWDDIKVDIMREVLYAKFTQHQDLRNKLFATGDAIIIEDAWWDEFWGCGKNGDGQNMLGKLLMELREKLRREK